MCVGLVSGRFNQGVYMFSGIIDVTKKELQKRWSTYVNSHYYTPHPSDPGAYQEYLPRSRRGALHIPAVYDGGRDLGPARSMFTFHAR